MDIPSDERLLQAWSHISDDDLPEALKIDPPYIYKEKPVDIRPYLVVVRRRVAYLRGVPFDGELNPPQLYSFGATVDVD